jgi:hypothetical protein
MIRSKNWRRVTLKVAVSLACLTQNHYLQWFATMSETADPLGATWRSRSRNLAISLAVRAIPTTGALTRPARQATVKIMVAAENNRYHLSSKSESSHGTVYV